jgi:hypothetical protein
VYVPVTMAFCVHRFWMKERPPIWRIAANILNKQSRMSDQGWFTSLAVGRNAYSSSPNKHILLRNVYTESLAPGLLRWYELRVTNPNRVYEDIVRREASFTLLVLLPFSPFTRHCPISMKDRACKVCSGIYKCGVLHYINI